MTYGCLPGAPPTFHSKVPQLRKAVPVSVAEEGHFEKSFFSVSVNREWAKAKYQIFKKKTVKKTLSIFKYMPSQGTNGIISLYLFVYKVCIYETISLGSVSKRLPKRTKMNHLQGWTNLAAFFEQKTSQNCF